MARKVFFSFHYKRDAVRAGQVRNSNVVSNRSVETSEFIDAAEWESIKRNGEGAIKSWIKNQLHGTSVTVVLIGAETSRRAWVKYEIDESLARGNGLLGIYIHNCRDFSGLCDSRGANPFDNLTINRNGYPQRLSTIYSTYDWVNDDGRNNLGSWIEAAARQAGK